MEGVIRKMRAAIGRIEADRTPAPVTAPLIRLAEPSCTPAARTGVKRKPAPLMEAFLVAKQKELQHHARVLQERLTREQNRSELLLLALKEVRGAPQQAGAPPPPSALGKLELEGRTWVQEMRPKNTSKAFRAGGAKYDAICEKLGLSEGKHRPEVLAKAMRVCFEAGQAESTINGSLVSAVSDRYRDTPWCNPANSQLVKDTKKVVAQNTPAPKKRKEMPREKFGSLLKEISRLVAEAKTLRDQLIRVRDAFALLAVYKIYTRPDGVVSLLTVDVSEQAFVIDGQNEKVLEVIVRDGKNNRGGEPHVALIAEGRDPLFSLLTWSQAYAQIEAAYRASVGWADRPRTLLYCLEGPNKGGPLAPATINRRLKQYLHLPCLAGESMKGITAYSFRVAGVSQAVRAGVDLRLVQRHGNWKSMAVLAYVAEDVGQRLEVTRAL